MAKKKTTTQNPGKKEEKTAREKLQQAMNVSFKLPEETAELLDQHEAEVTVRVLAEAALKIHTTPVDTRMGKYWHWYRFGLNRAAQRIMK